MRSRLVLALTILGTLAAPAAASVPTPDDGGGGGGADGPKVRELKPWKAEHRYKVVRDANIYAELNARSGAVARVIKGQWWRIDCQLQNTTQNGPVLWSHIPNVGWIADRNIKTYTDGRLEGSPTCELPGPRHVWFRQPWAAGKEYRFTRTLRARTRPDSTTTGRTYQSGAWTTIDCSTTANGRAWVRLWRAPKVGEGWVPADALRFWQRGLPAGLPTCAPAPVNRHWVAMGDSYAAGQGANEYIAGSGACRRSLNAYWSRLALRMKPGFQTDTGEFVACSGAETEDVLNRQLGQLDRDTGLVTISIGGNDLGFAAVLTNCVKPTGITCQESIATHFEPSDLRALERRLDAVYRAIRERAPNATVLVLGYPELVPRDHVDGCGAIDDGDAPHLRRAATLLNNVIAGTVGERPDFRFVGLVRTFVGHAACDDDTVDWINGIVPSDSQESFHPNAAGHRAIAARLASAAPRFFR